MSDPVVRTVLGDIGPSTLGPCDAHEHLFLVTPAQPGDEYDGVDEAVEEACAPSRRRGPLARRLDTDRARPRPPGLAQVARETGVNVVAATGLHRDVHYADDDPLRSTPASELAGRFAAELSAPGSRAA